MIFKNYKSSFRCHSKNAFTLIEILTVISIITILISILIPVLSASRSQGKEIVCKNNLKQLCLANQSYAIDNLDYYVPAAADIKYDPNNAMDFNLQRWYGRRKSTLDKFDNSEGPLALYLQNAELKCPQKIKYSKLSPDHKYYEGSNGGYGYNLLYIGSRIWKLGISAESCKTTARVSEIRQPSDTVMFADTATVKRFAEDNQDHLIKYSFAEPRYFSVNGVPDNTWDPDPSLHFRHRKNANIGYADGHVDNKKIAKYDNYNRDVSNPTPHDIGWFEPMDNSKFDLE